MSIRPHWLLVIAALALGAPASISAQPAPEDDGGAGQPERDPDRPPVDGLLEQAEAITRRVAELRGLGLKRPLQKGIRDRVELRGALITRLAEEYTDAEIESEARLYKRLGLLPREINYKELILDLLTEQIAGFYDQDAKELYIMAGLPRALQRPTMAHEIFHALQDQHFDILSMQAPFEPRENADFHTARSALIEGDATALMFDFTLHEQGRLPQGQIRTIAQMPMIVGTMANMSLGNLTSMDDLLGGGEVAGPTGVDLDESAMARAPAVVKDSLLFSYVGGMRFVLMAYQRLGSWEGVDAIYADAPVSSEQIIHPERYFAGDEPELLAFEPERALGEGWRRVYDNVAGEFQLHLGLRHHLRIERPKGAPLPGVDIDRAAEGWGGDRLLGFEGPQGEFVVAQMSSWDSVADARQYYEALNAALQTRFHGQALVVQSTAGGHGEASCYRLEREGEPAQRLYVERWGDLVLHIEGAPHVEMPEGHAKQAPVFAIRDASFATLERIGWPEVMAARQGGAAQGTDSGGEDR